MFRLTLLVSTLLLITACSQGRFDELQRQNRELQSKLDQASKITSLELQKRCADQAAKAFKEQWRGEGISGYTSHYNTKIGHCYMEVTERKHDYMSATLIDAFEGKQFGQLLLMTGLPTTCQVTTLSGEDKNCSNILEFGRLVKEYMEN